jgi:5-methylcytosine-specific restriction endonuclease McrA
VIPVALAPPPPNFEERVRRRGLDAIAELVGEETSRPRSGPKREKLFARPEDIPARHLPPYWTEVLGDLCKAYHSVCAYVSLYIHEATGDASVDHFIPKSKAVHLAYEWSNYRLCCGLMNSLKKDKVLLLDPFTVKDDWFALEFVDYQVKPGKGAVGPIEEAVLDTIDKLRLNTTECCKARQVYVELYLDTREVTLSFVERRAPFVARELRRQGLLRKGDI